MWGQGNAAAAAAAPSPEAAAAAASAAALARLPPEFGMPLCFGGSGVAGGVGARLYLNAVRRDAAAALRRQCAVQVGYGCAAQVGLGCTMQVGSRTGTAGFNQSAPSIREVCSNT